MANCINCGHELIWQNDFDFEDVGYGEVPEGIVHCYTCPNCGADIEVAVPFKKEIEDE